MPSIAVAASAAIWGLFWIPVRHLNSVGISAAWTSLFALGLAGIVFLLLFSVRCLKTRHLPWSVLATGLIGGGYFVLYTCSLVLTEVVKAILLIYLTPIWSIMLSKLMLNEKITPYRVISIFCGIAGVIVLLDILGGDLRWTKIGDLMALAAGFLWSLATVRIRKSHEVPVWQQVGAFYIGGALIAALIIIFPFQGLEKIPDFGALADSVLWFAIFLFFFVAAVYMILWGTQRLSPTRVGLLSMTEVVFGVTSAAILAGETFGWTQVAGVILILSAAFIDVFDRLAASSAGCSTRNR